ncbi:MAG: hypothetical protein IJU66_03840 [Oscillospiraceae bacterium]|nr:hypothetical protein [Oscillospiraceae bacterium]
MKRFDWLLRLASLLLTSYLLLAVTVFAAGSPGSEGDPLVTVSYLDETFLPQMLGRVNELLEQRDAALARRLSEQVDADIQRLSTQMGGQNIDNSTSEKHDTFTVVTLSEGQTLRGDIGCEVMLRVGSANCVSSSTPGLIDETDGSTLGGGSALVKNHIYMMTIEDRGVKATAATVKVLVRGGYTIR